MGQRVNYGAWWSYSFQRLGGLELGAEIWKAPARRSEPGQVRLTSFPDRRDRQLFAEAYADPDSGCSTVRPGTGGMRLPVCRGPLTYTGHEAIRADIAHFKAALQAAGVEEGFMTSIAPGSASRIGNEHYASDEEFVYACAEAMREEYKAIVDAGLVLQLDDPSIAENWDMINPAPSVEAYRRFSMIRVEALNHALRGLPEDRIRFHLCWGSWHGPHVTDIAMKDIVDVMLAVKCQGYSFEAGNVRHEHEWRVWESVKLPAGTVLIPGVVSHATNVVEHPELVAERIGRFAALVGRERVIAGTDCGLGGRIHPQLAWAKLESLAQGAAIATKQLWG
jgi:5-methyltetrahydropteroyltriglutamate--homocysteine methyltransferase